MTQIILIIIGLLIVALLLIKKSREMVVGICASALDQTVRKNAKKEQALALLRERGALSNNEIREHLGVSRRTVVRYLDALEREGKVEQVGGIGRGVVYRLK